jgi:hypothetical protein
MPLAKSLSERDFILGPIKEIAGLFNVPTRAVEFFIDNIRTKVGLKNKKLSPRSYVLSIH